MTKEEIIQWLKNYHDSLENRYAPVYVVDVLIAFHDFLLTPKNVLKENYLFNADIRPRVAGEMYKRHGPCAVGSLENNIWAIMIDHVGLMQIEAEAKEERKEINKVPE